MHFNHQLAGLAVVASHLIASASAASPPQEVAGESVNFAATNNQGGSGPSRNSFCDDLCQQFQDGNTVTSIGGTIDQSITGGGFGGGQGGGHGGGVVGGGYQIITGPSITPGPDGICGNDASAIWKLWAQAHAHAFPSSNVNIGPGGAGSNKICIDAYQLVRLTTAATQCYNQVNGAGGNSWSYSSGGSFTWSTGPGTGSMGQPGTGGPGQTAQNGNQGGGSQPIGGGGTGSTGQQGQIIDGGNSGNTGGNTGNTGGNAGNTVNTGSSGGNVVNGGSGGGHVSTGGSIGTTSSSTWGTGNVHNSAICFKILNKRTDRYLTTYGSEYAFASLTGYYSVFRAYPAKNVENGFTLTEVNRNGAKVNYPVKLMTGTGLFKPLYGDKDAVWTFNPVNFGDSCWGVPGKKMQSRSDWGGWGPNYRQASSGDDCVDVELEEMDC